MFVRSLCKSRPAKRQINLVCPEPGILRRLEHWCCADAWQVLDMQTREYYQQLGEMAKMSLLLPAHMGVVLGRLFECGPGYDQRKSRMLMPKGRSCPCKVTLSCSSVLLL